MKRIAALPFAAVFGLSLSFAATAPTALRDLQRASSYCNAGMKALSIGDVEKAKTQYGKALAIAPDYPDALVGMGHVAMRQSRFTEALELYGKGKASYAVLGDSIFDLEVKRFSAVQRQIISLRGALRSIQGERARGAQYGSGGNASALSREAYQIEEAIRTLEAVEMPNKQTPHEPPGELDFYVGNALFRLDRPDEALAAWEACAAKSPEFAKVQINLAVSYWKKRRFDDAKRCLAKATDLGFPVNPQMSADLERAAAGPAPAAPNIDR